MNKKMILGGVLGIFIVIFILSLIFTPPVQFNYLVGTIDYSTLLFIVVLLLLIIFIPSFDEKRESKIYLDTNGNLDVETPREYKPIKVTPISKILGRANIYGQKNLDYFAFNDGKIHIRNSKGDEVFGPLKDLEYTYKMDKNKVTGEWYIYQFKIKDKEGDSVQFNRHGTLFNDEEYADIEMLLSLAGTVNESKISKLTRKLYSVLSVVQDLDFSNLSSSAIELAGTTVTEKITNKAGEIAKKRIYDKLTDKKKSLFQRIKQYFWWILLGLAVICIVWYNIALWSEASNNDDEEYEFTEYNVSNYEPKESFLKNAPAGYYVCQFEDKTRFFYLAVAVWAEPNGVYQAPTGNVYQLNIDECNSDYTEYVCSVFTMLGGSTPMKIYIHKEGEDVSGQLLGMDGKTVYNYSGYLIFEEH